MTQGTEHWSHYWQNSKSLNSFGEGDAALGYTGNVQFYWHDIFSRMATGAVIVDIASGNGALAISAIAFSELHNKNFTVYACDIADVKPEVLFQADPDILTKLKKVQFYPATAIENLPFENNSIDLIISQFGFEYANQIEAVAECNRVLKPDGCFNALIHHADSFISKDSEAGLAFYKHCLSEAGFLTQVERLLMLAESCWLKKTSPTTNVDYVAQNKILFKIATDLKVQYSSTAAAFWCDDLLSRLVPVLASPRPGNLTSFLSFRHTVVLYMARLEDQVNATWSQDNKNNFINTFQSNLSALRVTPFYEEKALFAWSLYWHKAD
ncbi:class I SAM-dependent methyltransferase [Rheinheimera sp. YQF-2]|uniref:Class I SAM-dependent methyltransferase n=1 Tax=Rheinheimera lutimaris TaxID=2740584 RepID=A0A7Y5AQI3_9GAMM|nr:class I SAM-dependent methyltransferase [Rheinheimera lutimaris]NRQ42678.1 class I SAM-dependent methyltransferase [Rheinheimera lutimaris]